jgi:hypothetical protein
MGGCFTPHLRLLARHHAAPLARAPHFRSYSIWAVSKQTTIYRTRASLQINDPLEVTRGLTVPTRMSGMNIFVDPIESEIQVLSPAQVARSVVGPSTSPTPLRPATQDEQNTAG